MRLLPLLLIFTTGVLFLNCLPVDQNPPAKDDSVPESTHGITYSMKGVGIDLPQTDFVEMKNAGIEILSTEWGMEEDVGKVRKFLDQAQAAGLKVVMDGGFSYTAWGFTDADWDRLPRGKKPVWQKERVQNWIKAIKDHPAVYAWDICNEFGENLPSGADMQNSDWPESRITIEQLRQARADVLAVDNTRPIHVRMYEWDSDGMPPYIKSMLDERIADIISLNLYSNYLEGGKLQWPEVIKEAGPRCVAAIKQEAPQTIVWLSIAAFEDANMFQRPSPSSLARDMKYADEIAQLDGISFFCWGPVNQWDESNNWYLPKTGSDLWSVIKEEIAKTR